MSYKKGNIEIVKNKLRISWPNDDKIVMQMAEITINKDLLPRILYIMLGSYFLSDLDT